MLAEGVDNAQLFIGQADLELRLVLPDPGNCLCDLLSCQGARFLGQAAQPILAHATGRQRKRTQEDQIADRLGHRFPGAVFDRSCVRVLLGDVPLFLVERPAIELLGLLIEHLLDLAEKLILAGPVSDRAGRRKCCSATDDRVAAACCRAGNCGGC